MEERENCTYIQRIMGPSQLNSFKDTYDVTYDHVSHFRTIPGIKSLQKGISILEQPRKIILVMTYLRVTRP